MNNAKIREAAEIARQFIEAVVAMETEEKQRISGDGRYTYPSPKHRGSVRRKSMDLTRALAEMRGSK